jgi:hypothetical protein
MRSLETVFYTSENGDKWQILTGAHSDPIVEHIPNEASGGRKSTFELGAFLTFQRDSPQNRALHQLIAKHLMSDVPQGDGEIIAEAHGEADLMDSLRSD